MLPGFHTIDLIVILFSCIIPLLVIATSIFWIWMIIDCAMHEPSEGNDKIVWLLVIIFTHLIGALLYYFIRRPERIRVLGQ